MSERVSDERLENLRNWLAVHRDPVSRDASIAIEELIARRAADAWQAEPSEADKDGERHCYEVERHGVTDVKWIGEAWYWLVYFDPDETQELPFWAPLNGRRVRQIRRGE